MSDTPSCGVTYNHHSDDSRGIIIMIMLQAIGVNIIKIFTSLPKAE